MISASVRRFEVKKGPKKLNERYPASLSQEQRLMFLHMYSEPHSWFSSTPVVRIRPKEVLLFTIYSLQDVPPLSVFAATF